ELGAPGVAVAVIEDGKITFTQGFGTKDPSKDDPVAPTTLFRTGSVNKMLTAVAMLQQVAAGKVSLGEPVTTYVPDFKFAVDASWAETILGQHLLTHSSGMFDYLVINAPASQKTDAALETFMTGTFGSKDFLMNPAGAFWNYSNPNYYMAGLVAEKASGKPYRQLMKEDVFTPLGMDRTYFLGSEVLEDGDYALGKTAYPMVANPVLPDTYDNAWARPAGYATSNVLDLAKFAQFLLDGNEAVLPDALLQDMKSAQIDTQVFLDLVGYGYGLFANKGAYLGDSGFYSIPIVSHGGDIPGFAADLAIVPSLHFGFISMANADGAHFTKSLVTALTTLNTLPSPGTPPDTTVDPATFGQYEGTYQDDYNVGEIVVTKVGDDLEISMPAVDAANIPYDKVLVPVVGANFALKIQGTQLAITFIPDETGVMRYFRTRVFVGTRPLAPPPPPGPALEGSARDAFLAALRLSRPPIAEQLLTPPSAR
ncbi:MAG: serine hydrolase domain-containing protein, partial [Polyangiaceae bacterium]